MLHQHVRRVPRRSLALALAAGLLGCQTPTPLQGPGGTAQAPVGTELRHSLVFDVDPLHGAAFERPPLSVAAADVTGALKLEVTFPDVSHDLVTNQTTVTMQVANAGNALTYLKALAGGDRKLASPSAYGFSMGQVGAGGTVTQKLVFDNPGGGGFSVNLTMTGIMTVQAAPYRVQQAAGGLRAFADSAYGTLVPEQAVDGNLSTFWANNTYRQAEAWIAVDAGAPMSFTGLKVKMAPQTTGATYRIETSTDNVTYTPVTGPLKNTSWQLETKAFTGSGRYVRLHFFNDPVGPESRFMVFEIQVPGAPGGGEPVSPAPSPSASASASPSASPSPSPTPTPPSGDGLSENFQSYALGARPGQWKDVRDDGYNYPWLVPANWMVADNNGSKRFMHDNLSNTANLSFRRYTGSAFGANGVMPAHYYASVDVTPIRSYTYSPTGDQGTQHFYLNPTTYLEVLLKPNYQEVWAANDAAPFQGKGWQRLAYRTVNNSVNRTYNLAAEVNTATRQFKAYVDGQLLTSLTHPMLGTTQPHYFTLRGTGNIVGHDNVVIEPR